MKRLVQSFLKPFGLRLVRLNSFGKPSYGLDVLFPLLKRCGFAPKHVVDVGANHGTWTRKAIEYFPDASYLLVEPQDQLKRHVLDLIDLGYKIQWINAGAGDEPGTLPFTISHRDDSSSFMPASGDPHVSGNRQMSIRVRTLNEIVCTARMPAPDMVKIDAEGFDLKVLAGASDLFGQTDIFLVEAVVCCVDYQNTLLEITKFMSNVGYRLIDITDLVRSPKYDVLWLCEIVFLRRESRLLDCATSYE
jgi:FkbM family methyltransferase